MDLHAGLEAEQFADIGFREPVAPVPLQSYSFEGGSRRVLSCGDQLTRECFRNLNGDGHGILLILILPGPALAAFSKNGRKTAHWPKLT
jgi:hypothetical protein